MKEIYATMNFFHSSTQQETSDILCFCFFTSSLLKTAGYYCDKDPVI